MLDSNSDFIRDILLVPLKVQFTDFFMNYLIDKLGGSLTVESHVSFIKLSFDSYKFTIESIVFLGDNN